MRNELKSRGRDRSPLYFATLVALLGAGAAGAADTASPVSSKDGLMTFPNVRVVNAPQTATAAPKLAQAGMRAFIDPATGKLTEATQEQIDTLNAGATTQLQGTVQQQVQNVSANAYGGVGVRLGESAMEFAVARKVADGSAEFACVSGEEAARAFMALRAPTSERSVATTTARKEFAK